MFHQTALKSTTLIALLAIGVVYSFMTGFYGRELVVEAATFAILAISLDLIAGYGGLVSLCHGAIFGLGAYTYAGLTVLLDVPPPLALLAAIVVSVVFGMAVGAITSKTHGIFFIMATLAFNQMVYVLIFESRTLGGDDGLPGVPRLDLSLVGIEMNNSVHFALFAIALAGLAYTIAAFVLRSGFGRSLVGIHSNEARMRALGLSIWRVKAGAFAISGGLAGLAGTLAAQQTMFVSPEMMNWTVSGVILMVVILGGIGTLVGPMIGATLWVFLRHELSGITSYWHIIVGAILIVAILLGGRGIYGEVEARLEAMGRRRRLRALAVDGSGGAEDAPEQAKAAPGASGHA